MYDCFKRKERNAGCTLEVRLKDTLRGSVPCNGTRMSMLLAEA